MKACAASVLLLALLGCREPATEIRVTNESAWNIDHVLLSGKGFSAEIPSLGSGETTLLSVRSEGETGLAVKFTCEGHTVSIPQHGYFEGGGHYLVEVRIHRDLSASVTSTLRVR